eukprot:CAMPEP_0183797054 /NCGR_PEP_ID=MMETSP0803_2-20130417/14255_1 /TAXON_ID=195967 /ORGANISM="Crustomastix stigmata, Strain CCMP3273" /LENGTH=92 /DNA_ID=CAMNT_0026041713 /DNA_START=24 /DNA_END=302 /DNA_ORIENTATION=-
MSFMMDMRSRDRSGAEPMDAALCWLARWSRDCCALLPLSSETSEDLTLASSLFSTEDGALPRRSTAARMPPSMPPPHGRPEAFLAGCSSLRL